MTLFNEVFQSSTQGFTYLDNTFRGATQGRYASGRHVAGAGTAAYLEVTLGGIDFNRITGMSGGWYRDFSLPQRSIVEIRVNYELIMSTAYERDEFTQALCSVDGILVGSTPTVDYIGQAFGQGARTTSSWVKLNNVTLNSGNHRIIIGGFNNEKTEFLEQSMVRFRNVIIDYTPVTVAAPVKVPTKAPTKTPTKLPTRKPTRVPTKFPTKKPTKTPTKFPTKKPTKFPTKSPTKAPTVAQVLTSMMNSSSSPAASTSKTTNARGSRRTSTLRWARLMSRRSRIRIIAPVTLRPDRICRRSHQRTKVF